MTVEEVIKQTESFTIEQKQQLAYYVLFSTLNEDNKQLFLQLFTYGSNLENIKPKTDKRKLGYFPKGTFVMSDDFNKPLDDFLEYM